MYLVAPAKINLSLTVIGKRPDGYHEIASVMQSAGLFDEISVDIGRSGQVVSVTSDRADLPRGQGNTVYRAAKAVFKAFGVSASADIHIKKRIPVAAGLGGGSSDAAAVILGIAGALGFEADGLKAQWPVLSEVALDIGTDVPFCLSACAAVNESLGFAASEYAFTAALAEGKGERLTRLDLGKGPHVVVAELPVEVSTASVYRNVREYGDAHTSERLAKALMAGDKKNLVYDMKNDLQKVAISMYPEIAEAMDELSRLCPDASHVMMSGSGPTVFAYYPDRPKDLQEIENRLAALERESREERNIKHAYLAELY
ncbi:MAG: hypothetical protein LBK04_03750 [Clostridiales Family XIII bacterium]|jgi:4-diphosphocytidyl-2-C-methyl-D-erythritol kinase|nr:hypothetical protein [Clostridiales Family XIII bacterium]